MQRNPDTTLTPDFPRPYGVEQAEQQRLAVELVLDDPTLREALEMFALYPGDTPYLRPHVADGWPRIAYRALTIAQLVQVAKAAQVRFRALVHQTPLPADEIREYWRAMRGAQLVLSSRTIARIGGPFHA